MLDGSPLQANAASERGGGIANMIAAGHYEFDADSQVTDNAAPDGADVWQAVPADAVGV